MSSPEIRSYGFANKDLFLVGNRKNSFLTTIFGIFFKYYPKI